MNARWPAVLILSSAIGLAGCSGSPDGTDASPQTVIPEPTLDDVSLPPWGIPVDVPSHVSAAGLDLGPMGMAEHYHPKLRIVVNGTEVPVPPNIGVDPRTGAMSAVHTHEGDGTIHIEADSVGERFTLGQLFTQWGVALTAKQIGGARAASGGKVEVTSNGERVSGDPADLRLQPHQEIVLSVD